MISHMTAPPVQSATADFNTPPADAGAVTDMHSANVLAAAKELLVALLVAPLSCFNFIVSPKLILGTEQLRLST